jgi:hypothetical protein
LTVFFAPADGVLARYLITRIATTSAHAKNMDLCTHFCGKRRLLTQLQAIINPTEKLAAASDSLTVEKKFPVPSLNNRELQPLLAAPLLAAIRIVCQDCFIKALSVTLALLKNETKFKGGHPVSGSTEKLHET